MVITLKSGTNYMIYPLIGKIYVDGNFIDYFRIKEKQKKVIVPKGRELFVQVGRWTSNSIDLARLEEEGSSVLKISSKIQNGFFIFSYGLFFVTMLFFIFFHDNMNVYLGMAMLIPQLILAYKQTFQRKGLITIEKNVVEQHDKY